MFLLYAISPCLGSAPVWASAFILDVKADLISQGLSVQRRAHPSSLHKQRRLCSIKHVRFYFFIFIGPVAVL